MHSKVKMDEERHLQDRQRNLSTEDCSQSFEIPAALLHMF